MSLNRVRQFVGVLYKTFASWQRFGDEEDRGATGALMLGVLFGLIAGSALNCFRPQLVHDWLSSPPIYRLLVPAIAVLPVSFFFQTGGRGWRWAELSEATAPRMAARGTLYTIGTIVIVFGILMWSAWWANLKPGI